MRCSMPLKSKFTAEDVIEAAFSIARTQGPEKFSTRTIAQKMKSSTMPIYSCLSSMKELEEAVLKKAMDLLVSYGTRKWTGDTLLDMGIGYVMFAKKEKYLFRMLYVSERKVGSDEARRRLRQYAIDSLLEKMGDFEPSKGLTRQMKRDLISRIWIFALGLAVLLNNSLIEDLNEKQIGELLVDTGISILSGNWMRDEIYGRPEVSAFLKKTGFSNLNKHMASGLDLL